MRYGRGIFARTDSHRDLTRKTDRRMARTAQKTASKPEARTGDLFDASSASRTPSPAKPAIKAARGAPGDGGYTARHIEVLEGLEPVRRRPGMYIGGTDEKALHHLFAEVIDNAMDEAINGYATWIEVEVEASGFVSVTDNGRGIPVDPHPKFKNKSALEVIMCTLHAGGNSTPRCTVLRGDCTVSASR